MPRQASQANIHNTRGGGGLSVPGPDLSRSKIDQQGMGIVTHQNIKHTFTNGLNIEFKHGRKL